MPNDGLNEFNNVAGSEYENRKKAKSEKGENPSYDGMEKAQTDSKPEEDYGSIQWQVIDEGVFAPAGRTMKEIPPDVYEVRHNNSYGYHFVQKNIVTDQLLRLPDTVSDNVILKMQKFWGSKTRYNKFNLLFKRGFLLWGPPGSGKTCTLNLIMRDVVERGGIVLITDNPDLTSIGMQLVREIEPHKPIINIMEDFDAIMERFNEHSVLSLIDGEDQVDNVVHIATTNYPERLDSRMIQRPSRFDEIIKIDMPTSEARRYYLEHVIQNACDNPNFPEIVIEPLSEKELSRWVKDTDGMGISHLRDLVATVLGQGDPYEDVIARLKLMIPNRSKKPSSDFSSGGMGFGFGTSRDENE